MRVIDFDRLRRWPDVEAPELVAHDATDRLLLDTAEEALVAHPTRVSIIGDRYGALTLGAAALVGDHPLRVHQDGRSGELALAANAERLGSTAVVETHALDSALVAGARVVLLQLPRGLDALDETAELIAAHAHPDVEVFAGGRVKHMSTAMNDVLGRRFTAVRAGLARQKSRVLTATGPIRGGAPTWPRTARHGELLVVAHGAAFAGASVDIGTRALLAALDGAQAPAARPGLLAVDLGCGTGVLATSWALGHPDWSVVATDQSWAAVSSAEATAAANGVGDRVEVRRDDAGASLGAGSADLVMLNPPFHVGATVHAGIAHKLFDASARLLAPGGELWCVWNSHLGYRSVLERTVGPTRQVSRTPKFTVTVSTRR
ncbi:16S RNA G1207 methylase RsmC [Frigoribacterium faeni]|uniref:16S RNA G1207 methylase RsmC n=1 Tax=Frigoribacterium faeni TaxID=145483 RepID=A0ABQ0UMF7_9MICO|nr:methyltransferase [Frigoribacterium faeni]BFF16101.1 methyltransferase [Microbacterium flavescens]GEK82670.1 16S RNA G1207 methylase RsmC [Frigoribacterium faeni]